MKILALILVSLLLAEALNPVQDAKVKLKRKRKIKRPRKIELDDQISLASDLEAILPQKVSTSYQVSGKDIPPPTIQYHPSLAKYGIGALKAKVQRVARRNITQQTTTERLPKTASPDPYEGLPQTASPAPYESLPRRYTDDPVSFHALNTFIATEANRPQPRFSTTTQVPITTTTITSTTMSTAAPSYKDHDTQEDEYIEYEYVYEDEYIENVTESIPPQPVKKEISPEVEGPELVEEPDLVKEPEVVEEPEVAKDSTFKPSLREGFQPSKPGPALSLPVKRKVPTQPYQNSFGVAVDFAGFSSDNPLLHTYYKPFPTPEPTFKREIIPDHLLSHPNPGLNPSNPKDIYESQWTVSDVTRKPVLDVTREKIKYFGRGQPHPNEVQVTTQYNPYIDNLHPPTKGSTIPTDANLVQDASVGSPVSTLHQHHLGYPDLNPTTALPSAALLLLAPSGPRVPLLSRITHDIKDMFHGLRHSHRQPQERPDQTKSEPLMSRMSTIMSKLMGAHYGDRQFDGFDFVPLVVVLVASGLILAGLFPNAISNLSGGNVVLGRMDDVDISPLDHAINQLESGILMVSSLRRQDACAQKLACKLGNLAKERFQDSDLVLNALQMVVPDDYTSLSRYFEGSYRNIDSSSCSAECDRCINL